MESYTEASKTRKVHFLADAVNTFLGIEEDCIISDHSCWENGWVCPLLASWHLQNEKEGQNWGLSLALEAQNKTQAWMIKVIVFLPLI